MKGLVALIVIVTAMIASPGSAATPTSYHTAHPLNILLTNDDGYDAPGIRALYHALSAAGHHVTLVAPLTQQSGKGGSLDTRFDRPVAVVEQQPGIWSVASTPADAVRAGLDIAMAGHPPDVVISGANFGQNLTRAVMLQSGTVNAALQGLFRGVPAIAVSVGVRFDEHNDKPPFPSTLAAFAPTGRFVVRLLDALYRLNGPKLLPKGIALNVNVPVPYDTARAVRFAPLAAQPMMMLRWHRVAGTNSEEAKITAGPAARPAPGTDLNLFDKGFIVLTALDADMGTQPDDLRALEQLQPRAINAANQIR